MSDKILNEGLYHITSDENADSIINSKHIRPSNITTSYGKRKCFFFAGMPDYRDVYSNAHDFLYEYTAVKVNFNENNNIEEAKEKISKFKQRSLTDDAIVYEGKCKLEKESVSKVQLVLDLDENGKIHFREKTKEEIEKGNYEPSQELKDKLKIEGNTLDRITNILKIYEYNLENRKLLSAIYSKIKNIFTKSNKNQNLLLPEAENKSVEKVEEKNDFEDNLKDLVENTEIISNEKISEKESKERDIEQKEQEISI